jgi:GT2 family glycosyltransferase
VNPAAELAVVVLSYRNEDTILAAVDSLLAQPEELEIVVSHSGGGPTPTFLARERPGVRVLASDRRRLPGAARNAGVSATEAPFVAFLAGDCRALPGWAAGRLRHHRAGAAAVATALAPLDSTPASVASYLLTHSWRMPHLPWIAAPFSRLYRAPAAGVSYARPLLERFGPFAESLAAGEDTLLNDRLRQAGVELLWAPEVVTEHGYPTGAREMLAEQYQRGRLRGSLHGGPLRWRLAYALRTLLEPPLAAVRAARAPGVIPRGRGLSTAALLLAGTAVRVAGILRAGRPAGPGAGEFAALRHRRLVTDPGRDGAG